MPARTARGAKGPAGGRPICPSPPRPAPPPPPPGDHDRSRELAEQVGAQCREHGLLPLRWASAMLRAGLSVPGAAAEAQDCAATIVRRGGRFRPMTAG
ncbi:hypothetical protein [Nocardia brasiliensis]|uniref:hypothetical protein n=1 Tax=Nocardia brasiliensis TaxID=37326 RepID=UPI002458A4A4|nr:hypothetical protein [Nocardia brasiliensis]